MDKLTNTEIEWSRVEGQGLTRWVYIAEPTSYIREALETVFGLLDYEIPYV